LAILCWAPFVSATTVISLNLDGLVANADGIVVGRVLGSESHWNDSPRIILTVHTIAVSETLKGEDDASIEVFTVGGTVGNITLDVPGMATFSQGETAVVFLEEAGIFNTVLGLSQGKFTVRGDRAVNRIDGLELVGPNSGAPVEMEFESLRREILERLGTR
jgi:hypothetical protein